MGGPGRTEKTGIATVVDTYETPPHPTTFPLHLDGFVLIHTRM